VLVVVAILAAAFLLWVLSGYLPTRNVPIPEYTVVTKATDYEVRQYPTFIIAETAREENEGKGGFNALFRFISGENSGRAKLSMTAPVLESNRGVGQKLAMTAPVLLKGDEGAGTMAFIMPAGISFDELPRPTDPGIALREVTAHKVAVIRFSGLAGEKTLKEKTATLLMALRRDGVAVRSTPTTAFYDPPWTPPFMRRNEVMVEIEG